MKMSWPDAPQERRHGRGRTLARALVALLLIAAAVVLLAAAAGRV